MFLGKVPERSSRRQKVSEIDNLRWLINIRNKSNRQKIIGTKIIGKKVPREYSTIKRDE